MSRTPECRYCGNTDKRDLVRDQTIGEEPLIYCHPWCGPAPASADMEELDMTTADESRATKKPAPIEEPA